VSGRLLLAEVGRVFSESADSIADRKTARIASSSMMFAQ
jgi:hypothetical protein